jgi:glycosyltransferase involved in cell wall biosynthesis
VEAFAASHPGVQVIRHPRNLGKGAAVRTGVLAARGERVAFTDADLPLSCAVLQQMVARLKASDLVIASRGDEVAPGWRTRLHPRWVASRVFNRVVRGLFQLPYSDTQCGAKCFRWEAGRAIVSALRVEGFTFDVELLLLARRFGYTVERFPVRIAPSDRSTVGLVRHAGQVGRDLLRLYLGWHGRDSAAESQRGAMLPDGAESLRP